MIFLRGSYLIVWSGPILSFCLVPTLSSGLGPSCSCCLDIILFSGTNLVFCYDSHLRFCPVPILFSGTIPISTSVLFPSCFSTWYDSYLGFCPVPILFSRMIPISILSCSHPVFLVLGFLSDTHLFKGLASSCLLVREGPSCSCCLGTILFSGTIPISAFCMGPSCLLVRSPSWLSV
jgi:hypothetical protein